MIRIKTRIAKNITVYTSSPLSNGQWFSLVAVDGHVAKNIMSDTLRSAGEMHLQICCEYRVSK